MCSRQWVQNTVSDGAMMKGVRLVEELHDYQRKKPQDDVDARVNSMEGDKSD
jgi:hypothetical protein